MKRAPEPRLRLPHRLVRVASAVVLGLCCEPACRRAPARPNVLLITLDTTRADALGCYGAPGDPTPNLDRLARAGTRFDLAISTASVTPVAHASILTGLDNREHGLRVLSGLGGFKLPRDVPTLATILQSEGWNTIAVHSAFPVSGYFGFDRGFDVFDSFDGIFHPGVTGNMTWNLPVLQRRGDETIDRALGHVERAKQPFFLWVHLWDPHDNARVPPPEYLGPDIPRDRSGSVMPSRELYAAEVRYMDRQIGRLLDDLKQRGAFENTIVAVVADHGEGLGDHGWAAHRILYQEQIRVPLLVRVPGLAHVPHVAALVRAPDIAPTILEALGLAAPRAMSGRGLSSLMTGTPDAPRVAFADQLNGYDLNARMIDARPDDDFLYAVIAEPWKLVYRPLHPEKSELFDLASDPRELVNRFGTEPAVVLDLEQRLARHGGFVDAPFPPQADSGVSPDAAAKILAGLGYVAGRSSAADARWAFACPAHPTEVHDTPERCARCAGPLLLVKRP